MHPNRWLLGLALICVGFAVYGSLLPFDFGEFDPELAWQQLLRSAEHPPSLTGGGRVDFCTNVLVFVPFGFGIMGWRRARLSRPWSAAALALSTVLAAAGISLMNELAQAVLPRRVPSVYDVLAQVLGAAGGIIAWLLLGGPLMRWCNSVRASRRPPERLEFVLQAYFLLLFLVHVLPLDLTIHPGDLFEKYRLGRIALIPFDGLSLTGPVILELAMNVMLFIPVGMWALTLFTSSQRPVRSVMEATLIGAALVAFIELAQLFVFSRFTDTTDLIVSTCGVFIGAWTGRFVVSKSLRGETPRSTTAALWWLGLAALYLVVPCCYLWWPFEFTTDSQTIRARVDGMMRLPFYSLVVSSSPLRAISLVIERISLFIPFGLFLGNAAQRLSPAGRNGRLVVALGALTTAVVSALLEAGQVFIPQRVPDVTDILLATTGGGLGLLISQRLAVSPGELMTPSASG